MEKCQENNTLYMSEICLNTNINNISDCFPKDYIDNHLATIAGIVCIINAIIGTLGNLLTLVALPFAAQNEK